MLKLRRLTLQHHVSMNHFVQQHHLQVSTWAQLQEGKPAREALGIPVQ
jgi:hypothetical protein